MISSLLPEKIQFILFIIPIPITIILNFFLVKLTRHRWKAIHRASEFSVIFYIVALILFIEKTFHFAITGFLVIFLLLILSAHLVFQWRKATEVILRKGVKMVARISFILSVILYVLFVAYELVILVMKQIT